tara:strand:+ start:3246 stop:3572 length:327 start_codon:yes stop_codon:yes gene_type:complete
METSLNEHKELLNTIQELFTHCQNNLVNERSFNKLQKHHFNEKIKVFYNNLNIIKENIIDLYTDLEISDSVLPYNINSLYNEQKELNKICKDIFPILFPYILYRNNDY